jgi:hypothetical protein
MRLRGVGATGPNAGQFWERPNCGDQRTKIARLIIRHGMGYSYCAFRAYGRFHYYLAAQELNG